MKSTKWNKETVKEAVRTSATVADCLRKLDLKPLGSNYKTFNRYKKLYNLDTSHFLGRGHLQGKKRICKPFKKLEDLLVENGALDPSTIKHRLIKEEVFEYVCVECGIKEWNEKSIVLHLDHINGNNTDHRLENLRLLCPNCHSQTVTFCRRKDTKFTKLMNNKCIDCSADIKPQSTRCQSCAALACAIPKIIWPPIEELIALTDEIGFSAAGRKLGVSDNAIRKHILKHSQSQSASLPIPS